jgi:hypothetical protein
MCSSASRPSFRFVSLSVGIGEYLLEVAKERRTWDGALDQDAAPIQRVLLSTHKVEFGEAIQCTSDRWFRYVELGSQPANRLRLALQIACQKHAQLAGCQVGTIAANQCHYRLAEYVNRLFDRFRDHLCLPMPVAILRSKILLNESHS